MEENGLNFTRGVICTETGGKGTCHVSNLFLCFMHIKDVDDRQLLEKYEVPGVHERCLTESLLMKLKQIWQTSSDYRFPPNLDSRRDLFKS